MPREMLEDQIERGTFRSTVVAYMGEHVSKDLEDLILNGDTGSTDAWLALFNGMLKSATSNTVDAGGADLSSTLLRNLLQSMPEEYDSQSNLQFWTNKYARGKYRDSIATRATPLGDTIYTGAAKGQLGYDGVPLYRIPLFPNNLNAGGASDETNVLYLNPKNAIMGVQRKITLDTEFKIEEQVYLIVVTIRLAFAYEHEPAVAKMIKVQGQ